MTPEGYVKKNIVKFLDSIPNLKYELRQAGGFNYKKGRPDLWFVYNGRHYEVEVKAPGGYPGSLQLKAESEFKAAGAQYWRGESSADFKEWFMKSVI